MPSPDVKVSYEDSNGSRTMPAMAWVGNIATDVLYPRADIIDAYRKEESSQSPPPSQRVSAGYLKNSSFPRVSGSVL